ncbi:eCIS core domain-containing protein [Nocardioides lianchengensis]|uniref:eCIS core domain-containing protein n=1 Tax=Nocardioides lianchengensis TaxID=1045774 RepID=A0A1G6V8N0_9ACTN|nr:DUF4157 domain-containing protein [Nocardioides lianchengensis]NYG11190.1 hypothetical protein [Nocardioides lianchengensis]SDD50050.1 protein of unknown function [Nocardioides lianchengensis]
MTASTKQGLRRPEQETSSAEVRRDVAVEVEAATPVAPVPLPSLVVGAADDRAEVDADRVADAALSRLAPETDAHQHGAGCVHRLAAPAPAGATPVVGAAGGELDAATSDAITSRVGQGRAMPGDVRRRMEGAFGGSFSSVRIHDDAGAADLSRSVSARAFTVGSDVFFDRGQFAPETPAGERVLAHELAHTRQTGGGAHRMLHRLAYTDNPSTWDGERVRRSGEGVAGVFFVGPDRDVVVKPLNSTGTVEYANDFMAQGMNMPAPKTVRYAKGTPQANVLERLLMTAEGTRSDTEVTDQINGAKAYLIMEKMGGKSIQTLSNDEATEFLGNEQALKDTGRIMVSDAFLGNTDRLVGGNVNLGNFFYQASAGLLPGKVNTIDNDSKSTKGKTRTGRSGNKVVDGDLGSKIGYLEMLIDLQQRLGPIGAFLTKFMQAHRDNAGALGYLNTNRATIITAVSDGITQALTDMTALFNSNFDLVRQVANGDVESESSRNLSSAKGAAKYLQARQSGTSQADATAKLTKYVEYRAKRDKTPKGFKWVTKLVSKTGF